MTGLALHPRIDDEGGPAPDGFELHPGFVSKRDQQAIEDWIRAHATWPEPGGVPGLWLQTFGGSFGRAPAWGEAIARRLVAEHDFPEPPEDMLLIRYDRGTGITPHTDGPRYGDLIAGLTLASSRVLELGRGDALVRVLLVPGDLYVLSGEMRWEWTHAVPFAATDSFRGERHERRDGFSVTWRPNSWNRGKE